MTGVHLPKIHERRPLAAGALTLWIAVSPWVWGFAGSHPAVANHIAVVFAFGPLGPIIGNLRAAALVTVLGGAWLAVSPWVLGYATYHAAWLNETVTGFLLIVLCARLAAPSVLSNLRRQSSTTRRSDTMVHSR
jgi:hypothetical protein